MAVKHENVKWVDGLRGLASVSVVVTHLARAFDPNLFYPSNGPAPDHSPRVLQWPIIRVFLHGRIGIAVFALVTGYVCALKPIRQAKMGNVEGALTSVAKSAFRRIPRLILPATFATLFIWLITQLGAYRIARSSGSFWIATTSPEIRGNVWADFKSLLHELTTTWTRNTNTYDPNQWTLQPLLRGSMMVYMLIFGTIYAKQKYRMLISLLFSFYFFLAGEVTFSTQFFFGMFLSDLSNHQPSIDWTAARPWTRRILPPVLMFAGLWAASYPEDHAEWTPWSTQLSHVADHVLVLGQERSRFFTGLGMDLICLSIHFSPWLKDALSSRALLWLGKNSFAVYLIHGTLVRTLLTWCMYGITLPAKVEREVDGHMQLVNGPNLPSRGPVYLAVCIPPFFALLYFLANLWTGHVDPLCARWTAWLERVTFNEGEKQGGGLLMQQRPA